MKSEANSEHGAMEDGKTFTDSDENFGYCIRRASVLIWDDGDYKGFARWPKTFACERCGDYTPNM